jgi:glucose-1-phosphate thymidylyltransferase
MGIERKLVVPLWVILLVSAISGLGWMTLAFVLGHTAVGSHVLYDFLYEIAKAAFIGSAAGAFIKYVVPLPDEKHVDSTGDQSGVEKIFVERSKAAEKFLQAIRDQHNTELCVAGISLRDFLLDNGPSHEVWLAICKRLMDEEAREIAIPDRLKVRILLLDPYCPEGEFRFQVEQRELTQGLKQDVPLAIRAVIALCRDLKPELSEAEAAAQVAPFLEARLYQHGSFAFQFIMDAFATLEQYTYRERFDNASLPLLQYSRFSPVYERIIRSYNIVWASARPVAADLTRFGIGQGVRDSKLIGIYGQENRGKLTAREQDVICRGRAGDIISVQAHSARFYMHSAVTEIRDAGIRGAKIRLLVVNPTSRGAIFRAVADSASVEHIGHSLRNWTWRQHVLSKLYTDVHSSIQTALNLLEDGCDVEVRLSAADLSCAMLLSSDSIFVEQYSYGRNRSLVRNVPLGGEYAVLEFQRSQKSLLAPEERILQSAFEVLWDSYSISAEEYLRSAQDDKTFEEKTFESELQLLYKQLDTEIPDRQVTMVILAAGYGTRISPELAANPILRGKPKALLPVRNKPMIEWLLDAANDIAEIREIIVVTNERYFDQFQEWRNKAVMPIYRSVKIISDGTRTNDERKGAIGALNFAVAREHIRSSLFVVGGDNFFAGSFKEVIEKFLAQPRGVIVVHDEQSVDKIAGKLGVVKTDAKGQIVDFEEKPQQPKTTLASTLCYLLTKDNVLRLKAFVRDRPQADNTGEFIRHLIQQRERLEAFQFAGEWYDIGSLAEYEELCTKMDGN